MANLALNKAATTPRLSPSPTKSYWHTKGDPRAGVVLPRLPEHFKRSTCDVCIVGAGIAG